jgi:dipeptidyl aminopeptidase/acylaminoacyl peptidase
MVAATVPRRLVALAAGCALTLSLAAVAVSGTYQTEPVPPRTPDFTRMARDQARTDRAWREASAGVMRMEKIVYRSQAGDLDIPAFVFEPLTPGEPRSRAALVWVHENIRGHLYEHYIPYIREATARGYLVLAPEYRGSIGYGKAFYDAIDYGGAEVDDVVTALELLVSRYPQVDPARIAVIGWSHGGMIALLAATRERAPFSAVAAIAPVTNLFHRIGRKGTAHLLAIDPHNRFGGLPHQRPDVYTRRSPLFHVDELRVPVLVHLAANDDDVNIEEGMQLVDALRARKPQLAETKVYASPPGGHTFDRRVDPETWLPENTPEQRESWERVWAFLARVLEPADAVVR